MPMGKWAVADVFWTQVWQTAILYSAEGGEAAVDGNNHAGQEFGAGSNQPEEG